MTDELTKLLDRCEAAKVRAVNELSTKAAIVAFWLLDGACDKDSKRGKLARHCLTDNFTIDDIARTFSFSAPVAEDAAEFCRSEGYLQCPPMEDGERYCWPDIPCWVIPKEDSQQEVQP